MYCLDANVWVYYLDADLPEHDAVSSPVTDLLTSKPLFTTTVIQMEVVHYLAEQLADGHEAIDRFLNVEDTRVAELVREDVTTAAALLQQYHVTGIGGRDATIIAAMERNDVSELWTHDSGLKRLGERLDWLQIVDPVDADQ